ncbi:NAD(P)/FAD-dependent oxidoreductase [Corynebacterium atrinae]|uniref:NAD(P)/FAD-dependent oxidoreductase n=1 Tax=Corynebacterium atrinae TaxID=1336740 RepID=UPI0025B3156A|nr:FAD-binding oxidoreductase [Corynebacterium atrinae]
MAQIMVPLDLTYTARQPDSADVVIIGGGVMGMSTAWQLAARGIKNIVVIEQSTLGSGSSAKPLGGIRANFSDPSNVLLGKRSLEAYYRFEDDFGVDIELSRVGYLFLARTGAELEQLESSAVTQANLGTETHVVSPGEAAKINPFLNANALTGASFTPNDGYAAPAKVVEGYTRACLALGVTILDRTQVLDIQRTGDSLDAVITNRGQIRTSSVICAAGAWSAAIGEMVGVDLPVEPVRRMIGLTRQQPTPYPQIPFTLDLSTTMYFHNFYNGLLLGISHLEKSAFCREYSYEWLKEFDAAASICAPALENPDLEAGWSGYYENTPDHNALIGEASDLPGFFYITGFSGHGFLQAPAAGELVADLYEGKSSFMDPKPFSADRFNCADSGLREVNII